MSRTGERERARQAGAQISQILKHEIQEGRIAIHRPVGRLFLSGLSAGLDIGFSLFLIAVTKTQVHGVLPRPSLRRSSPTCMRLVSFVVLAARSCSPSRRLRPCCRSSTAKPHFRSWSGLGRGLCSDLVGAAVFAGLAVLIGPIALGLSTRRALEKIASSLTAHSRYRHRPQRTPGRLADGVVVVAGGLFAGDTISQIVLTWLIASVIGRHPPPPCGCRQRGGAGGRLRGAGGVGLG